MLKNALNHLTEFVARHFFQFDEGHIQVWARPVVPKGSFALGVLNMKDGGYPRKVGVKELQVGKSARVSCKIKLCKVWFGGRSRSKTPGEIK